MIDFKGLEAIYWTIKLGSITAAAEKLNTTQPAMSARVIQVEAEFGTKLFDRSNRTVIPTSVGRDVAAYAERMLQMRSEMLYSVADKFRISGNFRLGLGETIAHTWLPELVDKISDHYPKLTLEIDVDTAAYLRERLLHQKLDLAFFIGSTDSQSVIKRSLCDFSIRFFVSPGLAESSGKNVFDYFSTYPVMTYARMTQPYASVSALLSDPLFISPTLHASSSIAVVIKMAIAGMGIAAIPRDLVLDKLADGSLVELDTPFSLPALSFNAFWRSGPDDHLPRKIFELASSVVETSVASQHF
ncbi:LysR family transcriptional regulator (plasmid) [Agrobacterium sp. rho-13.3]|nr:LysR family transcriptional regulator [Agrobacterium sp. rho-13.3]